MSSLFISMFIILTTAVNAYSFDFEDIFEFVFEDVAQVVGIIVIIAIVIYFVRKKILNK